MPTLDELLANTQLTDDIKIALPNNGGEVTVGDLRSYAAASARARKEYEAEKKKAIELADQSLALFKAAEEKEAALKSAPHNRGDGGGKGNEIDWDADPVYAPVGKRFAEITPQFDEIKKELKAFKEALAAGFGFITSDYYDRQWNSIPEKDRPKDKSWRDFLDAAKQQNIKNRYGFDDPIEAFNRSTAADRRAAELKAAREEGMKEGEKKAAAANVTRPGSTPTLRKPGEAPKFKSLSDAMAAAVSDPEILRIANGDEGVA